MALPVVLHRIGSSVEISGLGSSAERVGRNRLEEWLAAARDNYDNHPTAWRRRKVVVLAQAARMLERPGSTPARWVLP